MRVHGCALGDRETEGLWNEFLRERGLTGVQVVSCETHRGLTYAICAVLKGVACLRCRVRFMKIVLIKVTPRGGRGRAQPSGRHVCAASRVQFHPWQRRARIRIPTKATTAAVCDHLITVDGAGSQPGPGQPRLPSEVVAIQVDDGMGAAVGAVVDLDGAIS
jgi:hypothetical protein